MRQQEDGLYGIGIEPSFGIGRYLDTSSFMPWRSHCLDHLGMVSAAGLGALPLLPSPRPSLLPAVVVLAGQRCLLVQTEGGNVLWDCLPLLDNETIHAINKLGSVRAGQRARAQPEAPLRTWAYVDFNPLLTCLPTPIRHAQRPHSTILLLL